MELERLSRETTKSLEWSGNKTKGGELIHVHMCVCSAEELS